MMDKIDIVYTWVDGADPIWRKKRQNAMSELGTENLEQHGNVEGRFRDNGELKYSLRSLEKYFPNHGNIYIVTDEQIPDFLQLDERIKIVFHKDFMNQDSLPTFSSKNIESHLVNIPGISETFISMNDDFFYGPDFCFKDLLGEKPIYYFAPWDNYYEQPYLISAISSESIMRKTFEDYLDMPYYSAHAPRVIIKNDFIQMKKEFEKLFLEVQKEVFRNHNNPSVLADLYPRWMVYRNKGIVGVKQDVYIQSGDNDFSRLLNSFKKIPFFCINDTGDNISKDDISLLKIPQVLEELFPEKSSFEK